MRAAVQASERARRGEDFAKSVRNAIERGVHLSALLRPPQGRSRGSKLVVVPAEAAQVTRAFEMRADGHTCPAIAAALNESGAKPRPQA